MAVKSYEEYLKEIEKNNQAKLDEQLGANKNNYAAQKEQVNKNYDEQIKEVTSDYQRLYEDNAVQKLINERKIAENMANLGTTDSGLNRTQQTAAQLSYSNQKGKIDLAKQKTLGTLAANLADSISQLDISEATSAQSIKDSWNQQNQAYAVNMYNKNLEADAEVKKAYYSALEKQAEQSNYMISVNGGSIRKNFTGTLAENGVRVEYGDGITTYTDTISGKKTTMDSRINPYTNSINPDTEYGVFEKGTGYQPNNISNHKLSAVKNETVTIRGLKQKVFTYDGKNYWVWDGRQNVYLPARKNNGNWEVYGLLEF